MTNKNKTVAELLNDVDADAVVRDGVLYYEQTIGRVFGPVLAELYEHIAMLNALLAQKELELKQYRNVPTHPVVMRDRKIVNLATQIEALDMLNNRLEQQNTNLSRAVAELTETKADFYRSGVADGLAQKNAERTHFSIEYKTDPNIRVLLHTSDGTFQIDADGKRERVVDTPSVNEELLAALDPAREEHAAHTARVKVEALHNFAEDYGGGKYGLMNCFDALKQYADQIAKEAQL